MKDIRLSSRPRGIGVLIGCAILTTPFVFMAAVHAGEKNLSFRFTAAEFLLVIAGLTQLRSLKAQRFSTTFLLILVLLLAFLNSCLINFSASSAAETMQFCLTFFLAYLAVRAGMVRETVRLPVIARSLALGAGFTALIAGLQMLYNVPHFFVRGGLPNNQIYGFYEIIGAPFLLAEIHQAFGKGKWPGLIAACATAIGISITLQDTGLLLAFLLEACILLFSLNFTPLRWLPALATALLIIFCHRTVHRESLSNFANPYETLDVSAAYEHSFRLANPQWGRLVSLNSDKHHSRLVVSLAALPMKREKIPAVPPAFDRNILKQRYAEWLATAKMLDAQPMTGVGPGNYQQRIGEFYSPIPKLNTAAPDTQNGWLVLGGAVGMPGMLALLAALFFGARGLYLPRNNQKNHAVVRNGDVKAMSAAAVGVLIGGLWAPLFQAGTLVPMGLLLAMIDCSIEERVLREDFFVRLGFRRAWPAAILPVTALLFLSSQLFSNPSEKKHYLWRAANAADQITKPMALAADTEAAEGAILTIPRGAGKGWRHEAGGAVAFDFDLPQAGRYNFWARTRWVDGCGNSFSVRFGGGQPLILGEDAVFDQWHWVALRSINLPKGRARVEISNREDGVALDKMLLTNDETFQPQGKWEMVFSRDLNGEPLIGWDILPQSPWKKYHQARINGLYLPAGKSSSGSPLLIDEPVKSDFQLDCRFQPVEPESTLRIIFLYQTMRDYLFVDLGSKSTSLGRMRDGKPETLARTTTTLPLQLNKPAILSVLFRGGMITVRRDGKTLLEQIDRRLSMGRCGFDSPTGDVLVDSFDLRPLEGIYYLWNAPNAQDSVGAASQSLAIGGPDWSNYSINLKLAKGRLPGPVRFNIDEKENQYLELLSSGDSFIIVSKAKGEVLEKRQLAYSMPKTAGKEGLLETLSLRAIDHDCILLIDDREIGRCVFSSKSSVRGSIKISTRDLAQAEVKGIRRFYDGFGGCDGNNSASWTPHGGRWQVSKNAAEGLEDCFAQLQDGTAFALAGDPFWENYELSCMVRAEGTNGAGVVFYWQDDANCDLLRWAPKKSRLPYAGQIQLVRRREGVDHVQVSAPLDMETGRWYELRKALSADMELIFVDGRQVLAAPGEPGHRGQIGLFCENNPHTYFDNVRVDFY